VEPYPTPPTFLLGVQRGNIMYTFTFTWQLTFRPCTIFMNTWRPSEVKGLTSGVARFLGDRPYQNLGTEKKSQSIIAIPFIWLNNSKFLDSRKKIF
jgi:hypothetical protein